MYMSTVHCVSDETIAAYCEARPDSSLSLEERRRIGEHLATCDRCVARVARIVRMMDTLAAARGRQ